MKIFSAAAVAVALSGAPALAASIDLSSFGLTEGGVIAQSDMATVAFLADLGLFTVEVDDGPFTAFLNVLVGDPVPAILDVVSPVSFSGEVVDFHIGTTSAAGLFLEDTTYLLALLELPDGSVFDIDAIDLDGFFARNATVTLREVNAALAPIPLPAAAPLLLAGLGAIAVIGRRARRKALAQAPA